MTQKNPPSLVLVELVFYMYIITKVGPDVHIPLKNSETSIPRREQDREVVEEKNGEEEDEKWGPLIIERRELSNFWHPRI